MSRTTAMWISTSPVGAACITVMTILPCQGAEVSGGGEGCKLGCGGGVEEEGGGGGVFEDFLLLSLPCFLDQLRNFREQHAKPHVVIAEKSIAVVQNIVVAEVKDTREGASLPDICPHCGAALTASAATHYPGESLRA